MTVSTITWSVPYLTYGAGFGAGEAVADLLSPTPTVEEVISQVADVVIDDTSVNSSGPNEQLINNEGIQYRIVTSPDGIVRLYVEGQTDPIQVDFVRDIVAADSTGVPIETRPTIWQLPSGRRILVGSGQAVQAFGQRALTAAASAGTEAIAVITGTTITAVVLTTGAVVVGVLIPSNAGQSNYQDFQLNEDSTTRFRTLQGESIGDL